MRPTVSTRRAAWALACVQGAARPRRRVLGQRRRLLHCSAVYAPLKLPLPACLPAAPQRSCIADGQPCDANGRACCSAAAQCVAPNFGGHTACVVPPRAPAVGGTSGQTSPDTITVTLTPLTTSAQWGGTGGWQCRLHGGRPAPSHTLPPRTASEHTALPATLGRLLRDPSQCCSDPAAVPCHHQGGAAGWAAPARASRRLPADPARTRPRVPVHGWSARRQ